MEPKQVLSLDQNGPGSNSNDGVLHIAQSSITETSLSDSLVSYPEHILLDSNWCNHTVILTLQHLGRIPISSNLVYSDINPFKLQNLSNMPGKLINFPHRNYLYKNGI